MKLLKYLREVFFSSLPLLIIILIVTIFVFPFTNLNDYGKIAIGYVMVLFGQAIFLTGLDNSILPIGKLVGSSVTKLNKISFILLFGLLFGLLATAAEPAINVLASQVALISPNINAPLFIWVISFGTGIAVAFAIYRIIKGIDLKYVFLIIYLSIFILVFFIPNQYVALAFDASGATTGGISVPFILALGLGISKTIGKNKTSDESFGIVGIASAGALIAVFIFGTAFGNQPVASYLPGTATNFSSLLINKLGVVALAISPIIIIFLFFQFFFIKLPKNRILRILLSSIVTFIGLWIFLVGIDYGFAFAGNYIGSVFVSAQAPIFYRWFLIPISFVLGFAIALSEPAVVILGEQVEEITNGFLKKKVIKLTLAFSIGIAAVLCVIKILFNIPILFFLVPLYLTALLLLVFTPKLFVALAFDSGGVAAGVITSAFLTPFALGISQALHQDILISGFGMIAFISVTPLIIVQILGIMYEQKVRKIKDVENRLLEAEIKPLVDEQKARVKEKQS